MQKTGTTGRMMNTVFMLLLFCVFATTVLMTLLSGAGAYQTVTDNMNQQYTERTCLSYLEAKVHHYDKMGMVKLEPFGDVVALALYEQIDDVQYKTLIYHHDGAVKELFFETGLKLQPQDGQTVLATKDLQFCWKQSNLLQLVCTAENNERIEVLVYLHGGEEVSLYA